MPSQSGRLNGPDFARRAGLACTGFIILKLLSPRILTAFFGSRSCIEMATLCDVVLPIARLVLEWGVTLAFLWVMLSLSLARWRDAKFPFWFLGYILFFLLSDLTWGITLRNPSSIFDVAGAIPGPPLTLLAALAITAAIAMLPPQDQDDEGGAKERLGEGSIAILSMITLFGIGELMLLWVPQALIGPARALGVFQIFITVPILVGAPLAPLVAAPTFLRCASLVEGDRWRSVAGRVLALSDCAVGIAAVTAAVLAFLSYSTRLGLIEDSVLLMQARALVSVCTCACLLIVLFAIDQLGTNAPQEEVTRGPGVKGLQLRVQSVSANQRTFAPRLKK
jgi:hypothetical protein